jgi:hypothetical protein
MTDSVLDWDSLFERYRRTVGSSRVDDIETKEQFKETCIRQFFRGDTNPDGIKGNHDKLVEKMWDRWSTEGLLENVPEVRIGVPPRPRGKLQRWVDNYGTNYNTSKFNRKNSVVVAFHDRKTGRFITNYVSAVRD